MRLNLGARIAVYCLLCAMEAVAIYTAAELRYDASARRMYQMDVEYNQAILRGNKQRERLAAIQQCAKEFRHLGISGCEAAYEERDAKEETRKRRELLDADYAARQVKP